MKKHLWLGLTALAMAAGAQAQSVTVYGFVNQALGKNFGSADKGLMDVAGSRLGFKGEEDLGGGMKASFLIEHRLDPSDGSASGPFWKGGSWVGLGGGFGKVTLGRWWSQAFLKTYFASDPFAMGTIGANFSQAKSFWLNNSVSYEYSAAGFSGGVQVSEANGLANRPWNLGVSYGAGPLYVGLGYDTNGVSGDKWTHGTVNYDFGVAKLITGFGTGTQGGAKERNLIVGANAPVGPNGTVIASFSQHKTASTTDRNRVALGYQHALSKRTKLYATFGNDSKVGTEKTAYDLGVLHSF
jgi:predicted porin